ncbi:MAG: hypothetical protein EKK60_16885 [Gordonia sp. (in: high G+C Gram-positive bacteria)]|nr:MAG: hypothetical protein EKK60_16885 [Gordonia sp. (in: high G+C Gram-positive bacteria)]
MAEGSMMAFNITIARKLAQARSLVMPLERTEEARHVVPGNGRTPATSIEWTFAPGHVVHEASARALREVGLELFVTSWSVTERGNMSVAFELVDLGGDQGVEWSSEFPIEGSKVGATLAGAAALAMVIRHTRLTLLDIPCVPPEEETRNRQASKGAADARRADARRAAVSWRPEPRQDEEGGDLPTWAAAKAESAPAHVEAPPAPPEAEIAAVEAELAEADIDIMKRRATMAWLAAKRGGLDLDLVDVIKQVVGEVKRWDDLTAGQWRAVVEELDRLAAGVGEVAGA